MKTSETSRKLFENVFFRGRGRLRPDASKTGQKRIENVSDISNLTASIIMNPNPKFIDKEALVYDAFIIMKDLNITQLIVLEENKYCGIIHLHDIIKEGIAE